ncbi:hypothetical protein QR685DRAFT_575610 [Neurospora intermedia]|uniref:Uncharacterized protein n=1 Tax=Neurospora intermedia TaxID=5142 RepID=A0ABR3CZY6_NEUIN
MRPTNTKRTDFTRLYSTRVGISLHWLFADISVIADLSKSYSSCFSLSPCAYDDQAIILFLDLRAQSLHSR